MNDLKVFDFEGQNVTDSRLVAEMLGMRHSDLLEKIKKYEAILANGKFRSPPKAIITNIQNLENIF